MAKTIVGRPIAGARRFAACVLAAAMLVFASAQADVQSTGSIPGVDHREQVPRLTAAPARAIRLAQIGPGPVVRLRNSGTACFRQVKDDGGTHFEVRFVPGFGCLSSSCTERLQSDFDVAIGGGAELEIEMSSAFAIRDRNRRICTRDCGGGGSATRQLPDLPPGTYPVTLGGQPVGVLDTNRLVSGETVCLPAR